jgi:site-specific recombinase XerD
LQAFFVDRLRRLRDASPHTIAGYRDSFRLLLRFAAEHLGKAPSDLDIENVDATFIAEFLDSLETSRGNSARTRNARLAAIHAFYRYVALREPSFSLLCQRILAIPAKRQVKKVIEYLTRPETEALLTAPPLSTWTGRRDRAMLMLTVQTGLRVSELTALRCKDVVLGPGAHVHCEGKGRKQRCTPLRRDTIEVLAGWLRERRGQCDDPLFPSIRGGALSRDAVELLLSKHVENAGRDCPSLKTKPVTPHVLRHSAAMDLLRNGVDRSVIALWLGHESVETTQIYLHADIRIKEEALARTSPIGTKPGRFRPDDALLAFLESL